ncbi:hypothetical protein ACFW9O_05830 [Streptomyces sp. NPDC059499]|uniref:hypothetical protein n=1 Tax=Streptomyces sp. NPDC059499 TaxID=3346852 RepID=UPI003696E548
MKTIAPPSDTLFGTPAAVATPPRGLVPATARLIATRSPDTTDAEQRLLLLLVVHCPYCDRAHVHPGGHLGAPRLCPRNSRCVGAPGGTYYFPAVQQ